MLLPLVVQLYKEFLQLLQVRYTTLGILNGHLSTLTIEYHYNNIIVILTSIM